MLYILGLYIVNVRILNYFHFHDTLVLMTIRLLNLLIIKYDNKSKQQTAMTLHDHNFIPTIKTVKNHYKIDKTLTHNLPVLYYMSAITTTPLPKSWMPFQIRNFPINEIK